MSFSLYLTMRKYFFLFFIIVCFSACKPNSIEEVCYECLAEKSNLQNTNLDSLIGTIETQLIAEQQLLSAEPSSYISFLHKIANSKEVKYNNLSPSVSSLVHLANLELIKNCKSRFENENYVGSTVEALDSCFFTLALNGRLTPEIVANSFLNTLDTKDFDKPYFKTVFWSVYSGLFITPMGIGRELPLNIDRQSSSIFNGIEGFISLNETDGIRWNNELITLEEVSDSVYFLVKASLLSGSKKESIGKLGIINVTNYKITISSKRETSYGLYMNIQNAINTGINTFKNEKSNEIYGIDYYSLDKEKTAQIGRIIKRYITETKL